MHKKLFSLALALAVLLMMPWNVSSLAASPQHHGKVHHGGITWPKGQALPSFSKPKHLDVVNIEKVPGDEKIMMATLEGIVNRKQPRIYLIEGNPGEGKYTWLNDINVPYTMHSSIWDVVNRYKKDIKGLIVYDPKETASINVATTMAGIKNGIVVSPELAKKLSAAPYDLPIIEDLRGKFTSDLQAYKWEFKNLWPKTTHRMLVGLNPTKSISLPKDNWKSFETVLQEKQQVRDSSNRKVYDLDLSKFLGKGSVYLRFQDAFPNDGWGPSVHQVTVKADGKVIAQFVPGTSGESKYLYDHGGSQVIGGAEGEHRFADAGSYFIYRFTPPKGTSKLTVSVDMWNEFNVSASNVQPVSSDAQTPYGFLRDYVVANRAMVFWLEPNKPEDHALFEKILSSVKPGTPYLGWFPNDVSGEFSGTQLTSEHGVYVLASDWFNNMTVFSGTHARMRKPKPLPKPKLKNKIYVTFTMSEGDNLQYVEHRMRQIWDDPGRGSVPINWTIDPVVYDAAPAFLGYFQRTETKNDLLIAGPSGAGYIYPNDWPNSSFDTYLKMTRKYMHRTKMNIAYVLNRVDNKDVGLSEQKAQAYEKLGLNGIFLNWEGQSKTTVLDNSLPQSVLMNSANTQDAINKIKQAASGWDGKSPKFVSVGILAWNNTPSDVKKIADALGSQFQVVRGDQFFQLVRQANGLPAGH